MRVLEQACCGKDGRPDSGEDLIVVARDFAAIIDGATDKSGLRFGTLSGGRLAAEAVADAVRGLDPEAQLGDLAAAASARLVRAVERSGVEVELAQYPSAVLVVYARRAQQIWRIGDGSWRAAGTSHLGTKAIDQVTADARVALLHARLAQGDTPEALAARDVGRELILPLLQAQGVFCNVAGPFGYAAINGTPVPECFHECWEADQLDELVLASDGYPELQDTLAATEAALQRSLQEDPLRIGRHRGTKALLPGNQSFDDRSYLRLRLT